jgi:hypothetical protein
MRYTVVIHYHDAELAPEIFGVETQKPKDSVVDTITTTLETLIGTRKEYLRKLRNMTMSDTDYDSVVDARFKTRVLPFDLGCVILPDHGKKDFNVLIETLDEWWESNIHMDPAS